MLLLIYGHWLWHSIMLRLDFFLFGHIKVLVKIKSQWVKWPKIDQRVQFQQRSQDQLQLKSFGLLIYQKHVDSLVNSDGPSLSKFKILKWDASFRWPFYPNSSPHFRMKIVIEIFSLIATLMDGCTFDDYFKMTGDIEGKISIHLNTIKYSYRIGSNLDIWLFFFPPVPSLRSNAFNRRSVQAVLKTRNKRY